MDVRVILVPTDFNDPSGQALSIGEGLAQAFNARLRLFHAIETPQSSKTPLMLTKEQRIQHVEMRLEAIARKLSVPCDVACSEASAGDAILTQAREHDAQLIVMATHGRTGLARAVMGSVAEYVLRRASVPVVTIRSTDGDASMD